MLKDIIKKIKNKQKINKQTIQINCVMSLLIFFVNLYHHNTFF
jgi:hypothetical protein